MYQHILIPVENAKTDQTILTHIRPLARLTGARLTLVHVADGWAARNYAQLGLRESEEMREDRAYLARLVAELEAEGFTVDAILAMGDPAGEIIKLASEQSVDLIAMTTHVRFADIVVAYAPGAMDAMMALALTLHIDPIFVGAHHLSRFVFVTIATPGIVHLFGRPQEDVDD